MFVSIRVDLCWPKFANTIIKTSTILSESTLHQQSYKCFLVTVNIAITIEISFCISTGINIGLELVWN